MSAANAAGLRRAIRKTNLVGGCPVAAGLPRQAGGVPSTGRNRRQPTKLLEQLPHLLVPIYRATAVPCIAVPASGHLDGRSWPVSDRRGHGPPPLMPEVGHGSTPSATGPDDHQGPLGEGRIPPRQLPRLPKAPRALNRLERTAQFRRAANGHARRLCCLSRWAPAEFANLLGEVMGGSGRSIGRALTAVLLMKWSF